MESKNSRKAQCYCVLMYEFVKMRRSLPKTSRPQLNPLQGLVSLYFIAAGARAMRISIALVGGIELGKKFDNTSLEIIKMYDNDEPFQLYNDQFPLYLCANTTGLIDYIKNYLKKATAWKKGGLKLMKPEDWFYGVLQEQIAQLEDVEKFCSEARI